MPGKAAISLTTGLEDPEKVTVAFLVAVGAAEQGRPTVMFLTKEAVRLALDGVATGVACDGCPPLADLLLRYTRAGGTLLVCPDLFQRQGARPGRAHQWGPVGWIGSALGLDRGGCHHLQLLMTRISSEKAAR